MHSVTGQDLWSFGLSTVVVITTNGIVKANGRCVMGRGCAKQARDNNRDLDLKLGTLITKHGNRAMRLGSWGGRTIVSMPTKHDWRDKADPDLIIASAQQLMQMADKFAWTDIVLPRPGCGNGQLDWADIEPLLDSILDDRFTVVSF